ncbi:hypothetical protein AB0O01_02605 [Streptomyces sp. NPDC093252]|uniref:GerMN domain-containing protein n=1 Tax=Streptomyces sp. NPDC093252 TaxID=3154980 RepID=UPI0034407AE7
MTRTRRRTRPAWTALLAAATLSACGVQPTGVLDGGDPAGGLTKGLRLYFVSQSGRLEAVSRPDIPVSADPDDLLGVLKYLMSGPTPAERASGLTTLLESGTFELSTGDRTVTLDIGAPALDPASLRDRNLTGQLVCSLARARAMADPSGTTRTDDIRVTIRPWSGPAPTHICSDFLGRG